MINFFLLERESIKGLSPTLDACISDTMYRFCNSIQNNVFLCCEVSSNREHIYSIKETEGSTITVLIPSSEVYITDLNLLMCTCRR